VTPERINRADKVDALHYMYDASSGSVRSINGFLKSSGVERSTSPPLRNHAATNLHAPNQQEQTKQL